MRILLVEDDRSLSRAVSTILQKNNYSVDCVENGQTALDYLEKDIYDAVIMDIMMPIKNGLEATREIRVLPRRDVKSVHILAMSANAFVEDIMNSKIAGMNMHLAKPLDETKLIEALKQCKKDEDFKSMSLS